MKDKKTEVMSQNLIRHSMLYTLSICNIHNDYIEHYTHFKSIK